MRGGGGGMGMGMDRGLPPALPRCRVPKGPIVPETRLSMVFRASTVPSASPRADTYAKPLSVG